MTLKQLIDSKNFFVGTFFKTPSTIVAEVLCHTEMDVFVLDAEHAPFDPQIADQCIAVFRMMGKPIIARPPSLKPEYIQYLLDSGAEGILAPHIVNAQSANMLVDACRYGAGKRGFSGSTRAASFGQKTMRNHLNDTNLNTIAIAMIEDLEAIDNLNEIFEVEDIHAFFIGRADLTASMGEDNILNERPMRVTQKILELGLKHNKVMGMLSPNPSDAEYWKKLGAHFLFMSSDQALMMQATNQLVAAVK